MRLVPSSKDFYPFWSSIPLPPKCSYSPTHPFLDFFQINTLLLISFFRQVSTQLILFGFLRLLHLGAKVEVLWLPILSLDILKSSQPRHSFLNDFLQIAFKNILIFLISLSDFFVLTDGKRTLGDGNILLMLSLTLLKIFLSPCEKYIQISNILVNKSIAWIKSRCWIWQAFFYLCTRGIEELTVQWGSLSSRCYIKLNTT